MQSQPSECFTKCPIRIACNKLKYSIFIEGIVFWVVLVGFFILLVVVFVYPSNVYEVVTMLYQLTKEATFTCTSAIPFAVQSKVYLEQIPCLLFALDSLGLSRGNCCSPEKQNPASANGRETC